MLHETRCAFALALLALSACGGDRGAPIAAPPPPEPLDAGAATPSSQDAGSSHADEDASAASALECTHCTGAPTDELKAELTRRAQKTRRCYNRALARNIGLQGHMRVGVRVASDGRVCGEDILQDEIGDRALTTCVRMAFAGELPAPTGGCVVLAVPLTFMVGDGGAPDGG